MQYKLIKVIGGVLKRIVINTLPDLNVILLQQILKLLVYGFNKEQFNYRHISITINYKQL